MTPVIAITLCFIVLALFVANIAITMQNNKKLENKPAKKEKRQSVANDIENIARRLNTGNVSHAKRTLMQIASVVREQL